MKIVQLSEVCEVKKGTSITKNRTKSGNIPVIAGGQKPAYFHGESNREGDTITISASGAYAGFVNFFKIPIFASDCTTIQSLDENEILTKYVYYMLKGQQNKIYGLQTGAGQPHIYAKDIVRLKIPKPSIYIQKKIISILDKTEMLKMKRQIANEETNRITQHMFYTMFGDPIKNLKKYDVKQLKDICNKITDGTHITPQYVQEGIPFWRVTDLTKSNLTKKYIAKEEHEELIKRCKPEKGDVLYSKNGTIGVAKLIDWNFEFSIFVSLCLIKIRKELVRPKYVEVFLNTPFALKQAMHHSKKGTISNLHLIEIKKIKIPIPTLEEQDKFIEKVVKIDRIKDTQKKSTESIETIYNALVQKALKGELATT
jgi:type I restriction enzyme, S subunit